ncbi:MAG: RDD family protein [Rhodanobacteraceae bacterium]
MPELRPAALWLRLAAAIYDLFPLIGLWMLTAALSLAATRGALDAHHPPLAYRVALLLVTAAYFVISWSRGGQTIGMRAWRLKLTAADGGALPWPRALLRFGVALISLFAFVLGFVWCLIDRDRRAWHDIAARSRLVREPTIG